MKHLPLLLLLLAGCVLTGCEDASLTNPAEPPVHPAVRVMPDLHHINAVSLDHHAISNLERLGVSQQVQDFYALQRRFEVPVYQAYTMTLERALVLK